MLAIGCWLLVVGLCDLMRAARDATTTRRRALIVATGVVLLLFAGLAVGMEGRAWLGLGLGWLVGFVLWVLGSTAALQRRTAGSRVIAFLGLGLGLVVSAVAGGVLDPVAWDPALAGSLLERVAPEAFVVAAGVVAVQLSTANIAIRLLLDAVGVPAASNEKQLKGGRVLGPMERLFIVGLGATGYVTAAAVVVAAKGLLRFPELQRGADADGPSDVTEYFLIGSFASWLIAGGGVLLIALAGSG